MSYSSDVKHEITMIDLDEEAQRAQLSSFLHLNSTMHIENRRIELQIQIENATIAKRIFQLVKERYNVETELKVLKRQNLNKNTIYRLRIKDRAIPILEDLGIYGKTSFRVVPYSHIVVKASSAQAYLAGAFLAAGSVNSPNKPDYHLEIAANTIEMAEFLVTIMEKFDLTPKITQRRSKFIVYIKAADKIADFLKIVGAQNLYLKFEDVRIQRDFRNSITRLDNMELANDVKTIQAGNKQLDAIYKLIEHNRLNHLDQRLIDVAELRMDHPESNLNELIEIYQRETGNKISKSGLQHRFSKILEISEKIDEKSS
ncbi:MAG: DNA-binding protein WhiA [Erysipelothrix sp.]|nr:DNA-binding protein WhiA [Erysipelothrix sp.]